MIVSYFAVRNYNISVKRANILAQINKNVPKYYHFANSIYQISDN